ncbi:MAG: hypothetical protein ACK502_07725 [Alphaproteobacteria bacterium]
MSNRADRKKARDQLVRKLMNLELPRLVDGTDTRTGGMRIPIVGEVKNSLDHEGITIAQLLQAGLLVSGTHQIDYRALIAAAREAVSPESPKGRSF